MSANGIPSEIGEGLGWLAGSGIAFLTLLIPLGSVLIDRADPLGTGSPAPAAAPIRMDASPPQASSGEPQRSALAAPAALSRP